MNLNKKHIPNIISLFRIFLVPILFILIILDSTLNIKEVTISITTIYSYKISIFLIVSGIIFIIASLSDFLDGYIARKYNLVSNSGKLLDAIADKILVNTVLIAFLANGILPVWVVFLLIIRDFCMDAFRLYLASGKSKILQASNLGKLKTIFLMIGISILFFINRSVILKNNNIIDMYSLINQLLLILIYIGTFFSILSFSVYLIKNIKINSKKKES